MAHDEDVEHEADRAWGADAAPLHSGDLPVMGTAVTADELADRIRAAGSGQPATPARRLPAIRKATVVRLDRDVRPRPPLPVVVRRVALATRESLRNPAVAASLATVATVAAQVGLRLLDQRAAARVAPRSPVGTLAAPPVSGWVRITETRSVTVQQLRPYP